MFLNKIEDFTEVSKKLKKKYSEQCTLCNGTGLVVDDKGHGTCKCIKKANIQARLICNGMPKKYINHSLENLSNRMSPSCIEKIKSYSENIEEYVWEGKGLFINGHDKDLIMQLEVVLANNLSFKKNDDGCFYNILFVTVEELMQAQQSSKTNYEIRNKLNKVIDNVDIIFINYLGEEIDNRSEIISKFINDIIVKRSFNSKITMLSSSLDIEEIANKYGIGLVTTIKHNYKPIKIVENNNIGEVGAENNGYY